MSIPKEITSKHHYIGSDELTAGFREYLISGAIKVQNPWVTWVTYDANLETPYESWLCPKCGDSDFIRDSLIKGHDQYWECPIKTPELLEKHLICVLTPYVSCDNQPTIFNKEEMEKIKRLVTDRLQQKIASYQER